MKKSLPPATIVTLSTTKVISAHSTIQFDDTKQLLNKQSSLLIKNKGQCPNENLTF